MPQVLHIPTETDADAAPWDQRVVLDGVPYVLRFQWFERTACWVLSVAADDGTALLRGVAVRNNVPLLRPFKADARLPQGDLVAVAETEPGRDARREELGARVQLYYLTAEVFGG